MQRGLCTRVYIAIYAYIQVIYIHIGSLEKIYIGHIYIYICLSIFVYVYFYAFCMLHMYKWVQIGANSCSHCTSMLPPMRRVALNPVQ